MKRSEMVKKIYNYILHECGDSSDLTHQHNSKIDAEAIMEIIEGAGMLPPLYNQNDGSGMPSYEVNEWEPEDEKK